MICQSCDRGQRYCAQECSQRARKASRQRAQSKYQKSVKGRFNNAARQQRFRQRQKEKEKKVTDQSSPSSPVNDLLVETMCAYENGPEIQPIHAETVCHFCGCLCDALFRVGFLKKRTVYPYYSKTVTDVGESIDEH